MASQLSPGVLRSGQSSPTKQRIKSFITRRSDSSEGSSNTFTSPDIPSDPSLPIFAQYAVNSPLASPLSEVPQNYNKSGPYSPAAFQSPSRSPVRSSDRAYYDNNSNHSPKKGRDPSKERGREPEQRENTRRGGPPISFSGQSIRGFMSRDSSPVKAHKKTKSATNLTSFLTRPKTGRKDEDDTKVTKDKENRTSRSSFPDQQETPIFKQFSGEPVSPHRPPHTADPRSNPGSMAMSRENVHERSKSGFGTGSRLPFRGTSRGRAKSVSANAPPNTATTMSKRAAAEPYIDPKDIDKHLEAMLDRRNIPENQRYKMRNLAASIKEEFIRQDWAEMAAASSKDMRSASGESGKHIMSVNTGVNSSAVDDKSEAEPSSKTKRNRGRSFTLSRIGVKTTKKGDKTLGTIGKHLRSKSSETLADDKPLNVAEGPETNAGGVHGNGTGLLAKIMGTAPADFVAYLRKTTNPSTMEVGKLHKLRLLLRNEAVSWIEDFIKQGGMKEMVGLLHRIMEIEWRDDHEDALLHEVLLCLKGLSTTALAQVYIHSIQDLLFPRLLHLLFDPEKKGPSEFTTRNIVTSILFLYIETGPPKERINRAANVLVHMRDPEPPENERPLNWVTSMHRPRPYRVWTKEVVNVTKEVFWIFLHHLNIIAMPDTKTLMADIAAEEAAAEAGGSEQEATLRYMARHFPAERPPVAAAPYVGGVEWDATNYLASHVDLLNAILACTPTKEARNHLRSELRASGWERCLGGSLRLCKEKFYPSVHEALRKWVAAAAEDEWDAKDVRYGPPPETRSRSISPSKSKAPAPIPPPLNISSGVSAVAAMKSPISVKPVEAPRLDLPVPKLLNDSDDESLGRGYNGAPVADIRADNSWLR